MPPSDYKENQSVRALRSVAHPKVRASALCVAHALPCLTHSDASDRRADQHLKKAKLRGSWAPMWRAGNGWPLGSKTGRPPTFEIGGLTSPPHCDIAMQYAARHIADISARDCRFRQVQLSAGATDKRFVYLMELTDGVTGRIVEGLRRTAVHSVADHFGKVGLEQLNIVGAALPVIIGHRA